MNTLAMERMMDRLLKAHTGEIGLMIQNVLWGMWLLAPHPTTNGASYAAMRQIMPEQAWGGISLALGIVLAWSRLSRWTRATSSALFLSCLWWALVAISFAVFNITSTAVPTYIAVAVTAGLSYVKCGARD